MGNRSSFVEGEVQHTCTRQVSASLTQLRDCLRRHFDRGMPQNIAESYDRLAGSIWRLIKADGNVDRVLVAQQVDSLDFIESLNRQLETATAARRAPVAPRSAFRRSSRN
jgi:hypothetical protein